MVRIKSHEPFRNAAQLLDLMVQRTRGQTDRIFEVLQRQVQGRNITLVYGFRAAMLIECWGQLRIQHLPGTSRKLLKGKHYRPRDCEGMFGSEPDSGSNRRDKHQQLLSPPLSYFFVKVLKVLQLEGLKKRERECAGPLIIHISCCQVFL